MKKLLAVLLTAMVAGSVAVVPVSAVEVTNSDVMAECKAIAEEVKDYVEGRGKNSGLLKLYFAYQNYPSPRIQTASYDLPDTWRFVAEYKIGKQKRYYVIANDDEEGLCNVWSGNELSGNPNPDTDRILNFYATLVYDYETGEVSSIKSELTPSDIDERKTLIEDTILPYFTENSDRTPIRVYSLQTSDENIRNLIEYQSNTGTYCITVNYNPKTKKIVILESDIVSVDSYDPALVNPDSVIYDCSTGTAEINEFSGTYLFSSSESETTPTNSESTSLTVSETESPSTNEPSTTTPKNGWVKESSAWYVYRNDQLLKNQWYQDGSKWYYLDDTGAMVTGWKDVAGKKYHFDSSGVMQTGWKLVDGSWHYFKGSGEMATGWLQVTSGSPWYYLKSDGKMVTGWMQIGNKWYCFKSNGEMYANTTTPDGYQVGSDGAQISEVNTSTSQEIQNDNYLNSHMSEEELYRCASQAASMIKRRLYNPNSFILNYVLVFDYEGYACALAINYSAMNLMGGYSREIKDFIYFGYDIFISEDYLDALDKYKLSKYISDKGFDFEELDVDRVLSGMQ